MFSIFVNLEPIRFNANTILFDELDEFSSVIYIINAFYHIGYSVNK